MQHLKRWNPGNRYLLAVIDVLSKKEEQVPLKNKSGTTVTQGFERILRQAGKRKPFGLHTDQGKQFYSTSVRRMLEREGIQHFSTHGDAKASVVERFNRTLKGRMYRYLTAANRELKIRTFSTRRRRKDRLGLGRV